MIFTQTLEHTIKKKWATTTMAQVTTRRMKYKWKYKQLGSYYSRGITQETYWIKNLSIWNYRHARSESSCLWRERWQRCSPWTSTKHSMMPTCKQRVKSQFYQRESSVRYVDTSLVIRVRDVVSVTVRFSVMRLTKTHVVWSQNKCKNIYKTSEMFHLFFKTRSMIPFHTRGKLTENNNKNRRWTIIDQLLQIRVVLR